MLYVLYPFFSPISVYAHVYFVVYVV